MKPVAYHPLAESELIQSAVFYEARREFLGEELLLAVEEALATIQRHPGVGRPEKAQSRSYKLRRFPYRLFYQEQTDRVWIVALAHLSRRQDYWRKRLES